MAVSDTLLGGGLALAGGVIGALMSGWQQRMAAKRDEEGQRSSALRTAAARYSQLAVISTNTTNAMVGRFYRSPDNTRVDRNPTLAADFVGALQELYLLTESAEVVNAASHLRKQVRIAFMEAEQMIEGYDIQSTDIQTAFESAQECVARAVDSRVEFLATVRTELQLKGIEPRILI